MNKKFTLFSWIEEITYIKSDWNKFNEDQIKLFEPYMIHRFLSMNPNYVEVVDLVQSSHLKEKKDIYNIYKELIPKKKTFSKYIKKTTTELSGDITKHIAFYYQVSLKEANEYLHILPNNTVEDILGDLGLEEKKVKKLLKDYNKSKKSSYI